jgi:hypothetical protein
MQENSEETNDLQNVFSTLEDIADIPARDWVRREQKREEKKEKYETFWKRRRQRIKENKKQRQIEDSKQNVNENVQKEKVHSNKELWKGKSIEEIEFHLPHVVIDLGFQYNMEPKVRPCSTDNYTPMNFS